MGTSNRDRRAAKQRRRDQKRGHVPTPTPAPPDRGLSAEALRRVISDAAADLAAGHEHAVTELRRLLAEHLARRREYVLAACDDVIADPVAPTGAAGSHRPVAAGSVPTGDPTSVPDPEGHTDPRADTRVDIRSDTRADDLRAAVARGDSVSGWADAADVSTEDAALATVGVLAGRLATTEWFA